MTHLGEGVVVGRTPEQQRDADHAETRAFLLACRRELEAARSSMKAAHGALEDLRAELAIERAKLDRYIARAKLLEQRLDDVRRIIR